MTRYQIVLLIVLAAWPFVILGLLFLMSRLENYVKTIGANSPAEAGLEPVSGRSDEREVQIVLDDKVIGEPQ